MHQYIVEFLGTAFLVFVILATGNYLAIGAALALAVFVGGKISGGAFNPAVTIAFMMAGKLSKTEVMPYILSQIVGAISAYHLTKFAKPILF